MRAQSYQTIAHGADTVQFFQLRRSVGGCEKFHGAVIAHVGTEDTRVFREVKQLGEELASLGTSTLGSVNETPVGMIFDWDNYWSFEYTSGPSVALEYVDQIHRYYKYFYDNNIGVSMIPWDGEFAKYKVIVAPVLYMVKKSMKEALEEYVKNGGILITTYMSGLVNESDNVYLGGYPGPLRNLTGVWVEEIDALLPQDQNEAIFADGYRSKCTIVCDLIHLEGADCMATYGRDFYAGMPAVTKNQYGAGCTYYIGSCMDQEGIAKVMEMAVSDGGVKPLVANATKLEITCRKAADWDFYFVMNFTDEVLEVPSEFVGNEDVLTGQPVQAGDVMKKYDVKIVKVKRQ